MLGLPVELDTVTDGNFATQFSGLADLNQW